MRHTRPHAARAASLVLSLFALLVFDAQAAAAQNAAAPEIAYTVSMSQPHTHLLEVEARLRWREGAAPARANLIMPVWTPGSYLVREFGRHVQDFAAQDAGGRRLQWAKADKNTWRSEERRVG